MYTIAKLVGSFYPIFWAFFAFNEKLQRWYQFNGVYKFKVNSTLKLKSKRSFGYGVDPTFEILSYNKETGGYVVNSRSIDNLEEINYDFFDWMKGRPVPDNAKYSTKEEKHFKSNIELHFKLI
jgi:hypothetical protein